MIKKAAIIFLIFTALLGGADRAVSSILDDKIDSLFVIASAGELRYRDMVEPAIDSIAAMGAAAVPWLIDKYDTKSARERLTINNILVKIGADAVPHMVQALHLGDTLQVSRICYSLGEIKDTAALAGLLDVTAHADWRVRSAAAGALGKIGDNRADKTIVRLLADSVETVRKSAAVTAGQLAIEEAVPVMVHMLGDDFYGARLCASESLVKLGHRSIQAIADSLESDRAMVGDLGCLTLGRIGGDFAAAIITTQLLSDSSTRRVMAVEGINLSNSWLACGAIEILKETEQDETVLFFIDKALEKYASQ